MIAPGAHFGDLFDPHVSAARGDPDTSHLAAGQARGLATRHMAIVARAVQTFDPGGLTSEQIAAACGLDYLQVVRRISDLKRAGIVEDSGRRRNNKSGRKASVWQISRSTGGESNES